MNFLDSLKTGPYVYQTFFGFFIYYFWLIGHRTNAKNGILLLKVVYVVFLLNKTSQFFRESDTIARKYSSNYVFLKLFL